MYEKCLSTKPLSVLLNVNRYVCVARKKQEVFKSKR